MTIAVATYAGRLDNVPDVGASTWAELEVVLAKFRRGPCTLATCLGSTCPHKDGPAWSPVVITGSRANDAVEAITAAVLDIDDAADTSWIDRLDGVALITHSSHTHRKDAPRLRAVIALAEPVPAGLWRRVLAAIVERYEIPADPSCKDLSRLYYLPSAPTDAPVVANSYEGEPLDWRTLELAPEQPAPIARTQAVVPVVEGELAERVERGRRAIEADIARRTAKPLSTEDEHRVTQLRHVLAGSRPTDVGTGNRRANRIGSWIAVADPSIGEDAAWEIARVTVEQINPALEERVRDGYRYAAQEELERRQGQEERREGWQWFKRELALEPSAPQISMVRLRDQLDAAHRKLVRPQTPDDVLARRVLGLVKQGLCIDAGEDIDEAIRAVVRFAEGASTDQVAGLLANSIRSLSREELVDRVRSVRAAPRVVDDDGADAASPRELAQRFIGAITDEDGPALRRWRGSWYAWRPDRGAYSEITDERLDAQLYRLPELDHRRLVTDTRHALTAVPNVLIDEAELGSWIEPALVDAPGTELAPCRNGILHLPTRTLYRSSPRYFTTSTLGVAYDAAAPEPTKWLAFLEEIWPGDPESAATLGEWFGYLLANDTSHQKALMLVGPTRCGKGTIMRVMRALLGEESIAAPTLASLATNFGPSVLIGKTAALIADVRIDGKSDTARIIETLLSLTGEDAMSIDRKHLAPWTGRLSVRATLACNELPVLADPSAAVAGRMIVLSLNQSFLNREDITLTATLTTELPGILLWALDGWDRLRARGHFRQPAAGQAASQELATIASAVRGWVAECCEVDPASELVTSVAYESFRSWCRDTGAADRGNSLFGRDMRAAGFRRDRSPTPDQHGRRPWFYRGLRVLTRR